MRSCTAARSVCVGKHCGLVAREDPAKERKMCIVKHCKSKHVFIFAFLWPQLVSMFHGRVSREGRHALSSVRGLQSIRWIRCQGQFECVCVCVCPQGLLPLTSPRRAGQCILIVIFVVEFWDILDKARPRPRVQCWYLLVLATPRK